MTRAHTSVAARRRMAGLSLIEMMIALVMALIVAAGIITVFTSTSSSNKVQAQMAALQEEGRFAIHSLRTDLANANGGYCSNTGGNAAETTGGLFLDALRSPIIYSTDNDAIAKAFADNTVSLPTATEPFAVPSFMYMRGYDCSTSECTPDDPNTTVSAIPAMGTAVGARVPGAALLTVRYIRPGAGWAISPGGSTVTADTHGVVTAVTLVPLAGEDPASNFHDGDLAMLADCSTAQVFSVGVGGGVLTPTGANYAQPLDLSRGAAPRVFDFSRDFQTITYFLRVVCANGTTVCADGHTTGELVRRVNGDSQPLVRGVERLDFMYGIIDSNGGTKFLTANQVDTGVDAAGNAIACPPGVSTVGGMPDDAAHGCLWRAVQTIQVNILMDGQAPLYTLTDAETNYVYTPDSMTMQAPTAHAVQPKADQGFPNQLIRREFTTLIALRNFNP